MMFLNSSPSFYVQGIFCIFQEIIYSGMWCTQFHQNSLDPSMAQPIISQPHLYSHQMKHLPLMIFLEYDKCFLQC